METSLHRQLKALYGAEADQQEVRVDGYVIDAIVNGRLIEIQQASLAAIRGKIRDLLGRHRVLVVNPLASRKYIVKHATRNRGDHLPTGKPHLERFH